MRFLPLSLAAAAALLLSTNAVPALMVAFATPSQRALAAETVVVGKVASIEKDAVEVDGAPGAPKTTYRIALVKVDSALVGATGLTHIKVGFIPAPDAPGAPAGVAPAPGVLPRPILPNRRGPLATQLKEGQEFVLFLDKHPTAGFHIMNFMNPPVDLSTDQGKKDLEDVKKVVAVLKDPKAALTSAKAEDRYFAACTMLSKHRQYPRGVAKAEQKPIPAEENALILKGLLEGDWDAATPGQPGGTMVIGLLGLNPKAGFVYPKIKPGQKIGGLYKQAFETWLKGPGKDFVIKQYVSGK